MLKRIAICTLVTFTWGILFFAAPSLAKESIPSWFIEQSLNNTVLSEKSSISSELPSENYYKFVHKDGQIISEEAVNQIIAGTYEEVKTDEANLKPNYEQPELVGVGIFQDGNTIYTDFLYSTGKESIEELRSTAVEKAVERHDKSKDQSSMNSFAETAATPTYSDSFTYRVVDTRNNNVLAGVFISNVEYTRRGTAPLSGVNSSVWDVQYFNQLSPRNSYQNRELITRSTVAPWIHQTMRSYGPTSAGKNSTVSVGLSGLVPSVSWNFNLYASSVTDYSRLNEKYARWVYSIALGSSTAKTTHVTQPGVRVTNNTGNIGFQHVHNIDFYKNLSANPAINTGSINRYLPDF